MPGLQGFHAEAKWIRGRFDERWLDDSSPAEQLTPVAEENVPFDKPEESAWLRFQITRDAARFASLGPGQIERHDGWVIGEVFVPFGEGPGPAEELCDVFAGIFRSARGPGIRFGASAAVRVGAVGPWFKMNVLCPFTRDTIHEEG